MIVYGIKNCNTVKKALNWLEDHNIEYQFHDYKKLGVTTEKIAEWQNKVSWELLINKRGTTWRKLDAELQNSIINPETAKVLMQEHTSLIKRPIIENGSDVLIGFNEEDYQDKLFI